MVSAGVAHACNKEFMSIYINIIYEGDSNMASIKMSIKISFEVYVISFLLIAAILISQ